MSVTVLLAATGGLLGLIVGSFLNVVAHRLPHRVSLVHPPSACPQCGHRIRAWENIPLLSYLLLRGRCRDCGSPIPLHYPATEAFTGAATAVAALAAGPGWILLPALLWTWLLIALARIDLDTQLLPDRLTLPLGFLGLLFSAAALVTPVFVLGPGPAMPSPLGSVLGAALGYGVLFLAAWGYYLATGREGLGGGDLKLLGAMGAWIGPVAVPLALFLAAVLGSLVGGVLILLRGGSRHLAIPFGPFLAAGGWVLFFWKDTIIRWYFGLSGLSG
jgi:leader peptidase (prepilin peptidase)/N-methyltransferase